MVAMIIKGLFRRYERWNPVHPTYGAFWGMGVGVGCGIGWGPGFGPEAIGYVGAGCGVGFSVGITLIGFGIGLPANYVFDVPSTAIVSTGRAAASLAEFNGLRSAKDAWENGWTSFAPRISAWQKEISGRFPGNRKKEDLDQGINVFDMSKKLPADVRSLSKSFESFLSHPFHPGKGSSSGDGNN